MPDFYFITSVVNMIWQIFTILFVLYRFTSFFNMLYNFTKFVRRLFKGLIYIKDRISLYITKHSRYSYVNRHENENTNQTTFQKIYNNIKRWLNKTPNTTIPLYETRESYIDNIDNLDNFDNFDNRVEVEIDDMHNTHDTHSMHDTHISSSIHDTDFEYHLSNMLNSNYESSVIFNQSSSSRYPPSKRPLSESMSYFTTNSTINEEQQIPMIKKHKSDEENILYSPVPINKAKKEILQSDFLVNFLNSKNNIHNTHNTYNTYNTQDNKVEENELKMSLLNSYDNFDGNLNNSIV